MENERIELTPEGYERLQEELRELIDVERPKIIEAVADARSHGDLRENSAYDAARQDQAMIEKRISDLENTLRNATVIERDASNSKKRTVTLGSKVVVEMEGDEEVFTIVGAAEARPSAGYISNASPIGKALEGHKAGDKVTAETPGGVLNIAIRSVDNSGE